MTDPTEEGAPQDGSIGGISMTALSRRRALENELTRELEKQIDDGIYKIDELKREIREQDQTIGRLRRSINSYFWWVVLLVVVLAISLVREHLYRRG